MRYKPKSIAALHIALVDCQIRCGSRWTEKSEYAVGDLRKVTTWPEKSGDYNPAGASSRKRRKDQQGYPSDSRLAETVGARRPS
jgi:hypothetical protein